MPNNKLKYLDSSTDFCSKFVFSKLFKESASSTKEFEIDPQEIEKAEKYENSFQRRMQSKLAPEMVRQNQDQVQVHIHPKIMRRFQKNWLPMIQMLKSIVPIVLRPRPKVL